MIKKTLFHFLFGLFIFCSAIPNVQAHTLEVDGDIGVTLHVHPDDEPVAGSPTPFYIDIEQRGQDFALINCQCSLVIEKDGQALAVLPVKYLQPPSYTFPQSGTYRIAISGKPIGAAPFKPFSTNFSYFVRPQPGSLNEIKKSPNTLQTIFPYVTLAVSLVILCIMLIPLNLNRKGKI